MLELADKKKIKSELKAKFPLQLYRQQLCIKVGESLSKKITRIGK